MAAPASQTLRAMAWMAAAGLVFATLNVLLRVLARELDPYQAQFLRYLFGLAVLLPLLLRHGLAAYRPHNLRGQAWRGLVHTAALATWFTALPHVPLAEVTAVSFSAPVFVMLGAVLFLAEPMRPARWAAAAVSLGGIGIVIAPGLGGADALWFAILAASAPLFAWSILITKALTRHDRSAVIVFWQAVFVTGFTLPLAIPGWSDPTPTQWLGFIAAGALGSIAQYCITQALSLAETSATQPVKFVELLWAASFGYLVFHDTPAWTTVAGATIILAATTWLARHEARRRG
jgi:drug/metabolite transporter (DMT)-like permease